MPDVDPALTPGDVRIERFTAAERNVLAARGLFGPLFEAYLAHSAAWVGQPDGLVRVMMQQGLAAAALYLTCRPADEETAWTVNFAEPPLNLFLAASGRAGSVVGRYYDEHVETAESNRLFVQTTRRIGKPHTSVIEVRGLDVLLILEQYYAQSEQTTTRFLEGEGEEFVMLMALPGIDDAWLRQLPREEGLSFAQWSDVHRIEERIVRFGCLCDEERIVEVVTGIFREKREELFQGESEVEVRCPRCGRAYRLSREAFEGALRRRRAQDRGAEPMGEDPPDRG
ncbi:MAG: hypothetical protein GF330_08670 [Candidatus Eisenbacteria bacterium]|nr:hypothetical protein [Candidatus Eisenbacteria bacterium]